MSVSVLGKWRGQSKKQPDNDQVGQIIHSPPLHYPLFPFWYAKIAEILATHDELFWPRLYSLKTPSGLPLLTVG